MMERAHEGELPLVLVVDDDEDQRFFAGEALAKFGFAMLEAEDGIEALALWERFKPEIILLDVRMPKMDGFETCAELRRLPGGDAVPVIMLTGLDDVDSINRAYEAGATDFITKPINWIILAQRVRYMIRAGRTANDLRRSEARNAAILNAIPDLMFRLSREGVFLEVKGAKGAELPMPQDELPGRRLWEVMPAEVAELAMNHMMLALEGGTTQVFEYSLPSSGKLRCYEARIVGGGRDEALCIVRDISERKQMEEGLLKAKKLEAVAMLAGGIAHDFNNLLAIILASINMVQMNMKEESHKIKLLAEAEKATLRARDLTSRFITIAAGGMVLKEPQFIETLVREAIDLVSRQSGVECTFSFPRELWVVEVDHELMRQAIGDIIANAGEAMPEGGLIEIFAENMKVNSQGSSASPLSLEDGKYVRLSIKDQGIGVARADLDKVFDPYFSTKERGARKGMGLGLTMAYSILKRHGGHVSLESEPGLGTTFHLYIPAASATGCFS